METSTLALDLGGTQIRAAIVTAEGRIISRSARPTPVRTGPVTVMEACLDTLDRVLDEVDSKGRTGIRGVGISAPGVTDPSSDLLDAHNLDPESKRLHLVGAIRSRFSLPAFLDRDTVVAALGEMSFGSATGATNLVYLTISTGIGGAIFVDGRVVRGQHWQAGELGHIPSYPYSRRCPCGQRGHLEGQASGQALASQARAAVRRGASPFLALRAQELAGVAITARDVVEGASAGDAECERILAGATRAIAIACVAIESALDPGLIVLGGSLAQGLGLTLVEAIRTELTHRGIGAPNAPTGVRLAALGDDAGLCGAVPLVSVRLQGQQA
jgi:glucokinase